jgi:hypothetical protein
LNPTTTNDAEAFHFHLNNDIHTPHPNIYIFVQSLLGQQTATYKSVGSLAFTRTAPRALREISKRVTVIYGIPTKYISSETLSKTNGISCGITLIAVYPW